MTIGWPQGIWLGLIMLRLIIHVSNNGKPLIGNYDPWIVVIGFCISAPLLWWGGFFGH